MTKRFHTIHNSSLGQTIRASYCHKPMLGSLRWKRGFWAGKFQQIKASIVEQ